MFNPSNIGYPDFSTEIQSQVRKMLLICRDTEKDEQGIEGQKANGTRRVYELVTFNLIMHTYGYVNEVE
ncbi:hypothetical protein LWI28_001125 [Acer negundo]|uniref:Uncharacterized protein n=1 Tax=Acer negundo TaxID=4023 RepID=A0AAD5J2L1_ACENE|nr:hypothetical protein LWI28_001125 [Acer negundo]